MSSEVQLEKGSGYCLIRLIASTDICGAVIGKSGSIVKNLRMQSGAKIFIDAEKKNIPKSTIQISGDKNSVVHAVLLFVDRLIDIAREAVELKYRSNDTIEVSFLLTYPQVAAVIGPSGKRYREIREKSGAFLRVEKDHLPRSNEKMVVVRGAPHSARVAVEMIIETYAEVYCENQTRQTKFYEPNPADFEPTAPGDYAQNPPFDARPHPHPAPSYAPPNDYAPFAARAPNAYPVPDVYRFDFPRPESHHYVPTEISRYDAVALPRPRSRQSPRRSPSPRWADHRRSDYHRSDYERSDYDRSDHRRSETAQSGDRDERLSSKRPRGRRDLSDLMPYGEAERATVRVPVSKSMAGFVIGKANCNLVRLERETGVAISKDRGADAAGAMHLVIEGTKEAVRMAVFGLESVVKSF